MNKIFETVNVSKIYKVGEDEIIAVDNVSLEIYEGEFLAIVGKSGSGKSTLMHIIGLLDTPTSGKIILNGEETQIHSDKRLAQIRNKEIGFVFQSFNLLSRATALENVVLPLQYSDTPREQWKNKAKEMLELVELTTRMNNKSNELSGGQKQRVAIARALVNEPSIILADEPTGNLDSRTGQEIVELFKKLNKQGKTVVMVTHDEDLAAIAQRKIVMKDGKRVE